MDEAGFTEGESLGHVNTLAAATTIFAGTGYDAAGFKGYGVVAAKRADLAPIGVLRILDFQGNYSNWALRVEAVRDDGTVVFWVAKLGPPSVSHGWTLVLWDPRSGDLSALTSNEGSSTDDYSFALDVLR